MYIGSSPNFGALDSQTITSANGSTATFTLNQYVPDSDSIIVTVGNVVQEPTEAYTASGNSITFTENVPNGDTIVIRYLGRSVDVYTGYKRVQRFKYVATNGQQTFSGNDANSRSLEYTAQDIDVFYNGVRLDESEFTASNGSSITLGTGATTNAELVILAYKVVQLADVVPASSGGTFTGNVVFSGNATVNGNLTASGTTTLVDTTNTVIKDNLLGLNHGATSNSNDAGIIVERGSTGNDALLIWDESEDKWALGTTTSNASSTGNLNMTTGTLVANLEGTIQTASQTNITAVGTLTNFRSTGIDDNADATAITIDSSEDVTLSGHLASGVNKNIDLRDADGHVSGRLRNVSGSNNALTIEADPDNSASGSYISFKVDTNEKLKLTDAGNLQLGSAGDFAGTDDALQLGSSQQFKLYHNGGGGNSVACILSTANSMQIFTDVVRFTSADQAESLFGADKNDAFFAKFDNVTKLQTYSQGIQSSGNIRTGNSGDRAIISRAPITGTTVNNGSTTTVAGVNGVLHNIVIVSDGGGSGGCFAMSYNTGVTKLAGSGNYTSSQNTSSSTNIYKSSNSHAVTLQNNSGSDRSYFILVLASYD